ncbi:acyl-CoA N-acyltransferase [Mycena galopus ATCC 62051]|nr:acyl-CoA N-acyltransferase [Mycena galopus ATCC 62051]
MPATHTIPIPVGPPTGIVVKNGIEQQAQILSRRQDQVYVHYVNQDKRMDEWIPEVDFMPSATDSHHSRKRKRSQQGDSDDESIPDGELWVEENGVERTMVVSEEDYDFEHHKQITAQRNFDKVHFGEWLIRTWYFSPYPLMENEESELPVGGSNALNGHSNAAQNGAGPSSVASPVPKIPGVRHTTARSHARVLDLLAGGLARTETKAMLWVCEFCFKYMADPALYELHRLKCNHTHPPGRKVYQRGAHIIWEVDGALYCQNLSLFGKLFIDVKTLFFDCDNFLFYVMTDATTSKKDQVYGFFSKEKVSYDDYNLACIITLPPHQRKGFGMLMIEFSYELCRRAGKVGTPERPLSDLGLRSYLAYWVGTLIRFFRRVLSILPTGASKVTSKDLSKDLRSPSRELEEDTPSVVNGNGTPSNGVAPKQKKKRTKGWDGEVADLSSLGAPPPGDEEFLSQFRTFEITANANGSATLDVVLRCTLRDIARATNLRVEDAAFALNEIGLLALRLSSEDAEKVWEAMQTEPNAPTGGAGSASTDAVNQFVFISRAMVERVAADRKVKVPCMDVNYCIAD